MAILAVVPDHHYPIGAGVHAAPFNSTGLHGAGAAIYAFLIGLLMAQYTYTGYDASAHLSEETHDAARKAPQGIVMSVVVSVVAGFFLLFAVTWAIQDYAGELGRRRSRRRRSSSTRPAATPASSCCSSAWSRSSSAAWRR